MPLVIDATAGGAASNSYATVAAADAYLAFRIGAGAWGTSPAGYAADLKAQALVSATRDIDTLDFIGERASDTQALEWPRIADDYATDELPSDLVAATIELAFLYAQQVTASATADPLNPASNGNLKRKKVGPIEREWFAPTTTATIDVSRFPALIQALLAGLLHEVATGRWGTAVTVRSS